MFEQKSLVIGDQTAEIPVIQGGMGVGVSLANLAGSVASCGGVGVISTAQIGWREEDFQRNLQRQGNSGSEYHGCHTELQRVCEAGGEEQN